MNSQENVFLNLRQDGKHQGEDGIHPFYRYTRKTETLIYQDALWRIDRKLQGCFQNEDR